MHEPLLLAAPERTPIPIHAQHYRAFGSPPELFLQSVATKLGLKIINPKIVLTLALAPTAAKTQGGRLVSGSGTESAPGKASKMC